jgi:UDP-3-O-[3-hydroxymyristoyl] glucosamine N-acyltransferase LpxD
MNPQDKHVTFVRNKNYFKYLDGLDKDIWVMIPVEYVPEMNLRGPVKWFKADNCEYWFTVYHNYINKNKKTSPLISHNAKLHETVLVGEPGLKVVNAPDGSKISFIHTGNVVIEDDVEIGPYSVIHRGTLESTTIKKGCKMGAYTNVGHNCYIDENTIFAAGVILNGGVNIGKNCWVGSGAIIKHYVKVTDKVVIGMGSVVTKDITKSGIYVGNPAKYLKPLNKGWNF